MNDEAPSVQMIPTDQINVINPRSRNKVVFQSIVSNISALGLKKPITVAPRSQPSDGKKYDLVCGQGRLEAYIALGQPEIPAIVTEATREDCFLMSQRNAPASVCRHRAITRDAVNSPLTLSRSVVGSTVTTPPSWRIFTMTSSVTLG